MERSLRIISAVLCFILLIPLFGAIETGAGRSFVTVAFDSAEKSNLISIPDISIFRGDVNADGKISSKDSLLIKKYIALACGGIDLDGADADGNGKINVSDAALVKKLIVGLYEPITVNVPSAALSFNEETSSFEITALKNFPRVIVSLGEEINTASYKYALISYSAPGQNAESWRIAYSNGAEDRFSAGTGGESFQCIFSHTADSDWSGSILSLTVESTLEAGESFSLEYVSFASNEENAYRAIDVQNGTVFEDPMACIIFDDAETTALIQAKNHTTVSFSSSEEAAKLTVSGDSGDPQTSIDYESAELSADEYKYITLTYMVPSTTSSTAGKSEFFLCAGDVTTPTAGYNATFSPVKDGAYHYVVISLASQSYWTGDIHLIRLDYFSTCSVGDSMYVDSICLSKTRAEAFEKGYERVGERGSVAGAYQASTEINGTAADLTYYNAASCTDGGTCTFSGNTTLIIGGAHSAFNRFSFEYSTNAIVRGVAYYTCDGVEYEDEFFLENTGGETVTFRSLIVGYFEGEYASGLKMVDLYTINTSSASVKISAVTEEICDEYEQTTYYFTNDRYKLGVDLLMGGGINYLEDFNDNNANYTNILNNYDVGRLIQQSYYGIDRAPYPMGTWSGSAWGYNPVQGGDKDNHISRIVDFEFRGDDTFYVKARPMDWGQVNMATPSYMENVYTLTDTYIYVYNRFVDFSGYTHTSGWQELPAFYTISALNNFYYYNGSSPWTNDTLIKRSDLIFWGQTNNQAFELKATSEFWSAWCDNSGFGVGLYVPGVYTLHAGKYMYDGSTDPSAHSTNYVAPRRYITLVCGKPLEYSYLITAGSLGDIRDTFRSNRALINNYTLEHYN